MTSPPLHVSFDSYYMYEAPEEEDVLISQLYTLDTFLAMPLAFVGLMLNALALYTWQADPVYDSTVLVLKCLALWDILFSGLAVAWLLLPLRYHLYRFDVGELVVWHVGNVCQMMTVYVTVLLVLVRFWIGFPRSGSRRRCGLATATVCTDTRRKILLANFVILVFGTLLESLEVVLVRDIRTKGYNTQLFYFRRFFALWLPIVPMMIGLGLLAWRVCKEREDEADDGTTPPLQNQPSQPPAHDTVSNASDPPVAMTRDPLRISRRLTKLVLWVCSYTALAYTAWFVTKTVQSVSRPNLDEMVKFYVWLFVLLKSAVNPVFYVALSPGFRHLLRFRMSQLCSVLPSKCRSGNGGNSCHCCPPPRGVTVGDMPLMEMQDG